MSRLAVDGGSPVRSALLPYGRQSVDEDDIRAVVDVLRSSWLTTGPRIMEFEELVAKRVGAAHAVAVSNGTAALHAALASLDLKPGDEVITTPLTFAATANAVLYVGATVKFADVDPATLNLDPRAVEAAAGPRTRAVIAVDYAGLPADLDELRDVCSKRGLALLEDAAHALGASYRGKPVGSVADVTTFSFHPVKHVTTGEGGMVTTGDAACAARLRRFRNHGIDADHGQRASDGTWVYAVAGLGFNYRLTDLQCALGMSQFAKLDGWLSRRREIAARYARAFGALPQVELPAERSDRTHAWHLYVLRLRLDRLRVGRAEVFKALRAENIGVNVHYIPVPWHPLYQERGYAKGAWPAAEGAYERLLTLPLFPAMSDRDADDVVDAVCKVLEAYKS